MVESGSPSLQCLEGCDEPPFDSQQHDRKFCRHLSILDHIPSARLSEWLYSKAVVGREWTDLERNGVSTTFNTSLTDGVYSGYENLPHCWIRESEDDHILVLNTFILYVLSLILSCQQHIFNLAKLNTLLKSFQARSKIIPGSNEVSSHTQLHLSFHMSYKYIIYTLPCGEEPNSLSFCRTYSPSLVNEIEVLGLPTQSTFQTCWPVSSIHALSSNNWRISGPQFPAHTFHRML